jgi:hypothetical protein
VGVKLVDEKRISRSESWKSGVFENWIPTVCGNRLRLFRSIALLSSIEVQGLGASERSLGRFYRSTGRP